MLNNLVPWVDGRTPFQTLCGLEFSKINMSNFQMFGSPCYALDAWLQSRLKTIPKRNLMHIWAYMLVAHHCMLLMSLLFLSLDQPCFASVSCCVWWWLYHGSISLNSSCATSLGWTCQFFGCYLDLHWEAGWNLAVDSTYWNRWWGFSGANLSTNV